MSKGGKVAIMNASQSGKWLCEDLDKFWARLAESGNHGDTTQDP